MNKTNELLIVAVFVAIITLIPILFVPQAAEAQYGCAYHSYQRCVGSYLYWYDSCGNQQDVAQYCYNGCYNNYCLYSNYYNYNDYNNCTYHAYKQCLGNSIYWYSSCGVQQDLYSICPSSLICQYGQCANYVQPAYQPIQLNYNPYYKKICSGSSILWQDSLGAVSGLYKNCDDANSCTLDFCSGDICSNILKCDKSTCADNSADYNTYCLPSMPQINTDANTDTPATIDTTTDTTTDAATDLPTEDNDNIDQVTAALSNADTTSVMSNFKSLLSHWYTWVFGGIVLIFLFVIIFKRLSSES